MSEFCWLKAHCPNEDCPILLHAAKAEATHALEWDEARQQELSNLQDQLDSHLSNLGQGQLDAQLEMMNVARMRVEKEARAHEFELAQQERFAKALQKQRDQNSSQVRNLETHRARREAILRAEREKAKAFNRGLKNKSQAHQEQQAAVTREENVRRRQGQHSLQDFKFTRIHEQLVVPAAATAEPPAPDPVETAQQTSKRWVLLQLAWCVTEHCQSVVNSKHIKRQ